MVLSAYGFVQPFRHWTANVLELVLSIDALVLLLLRGTTTVEDAMGTPSIIGSSQVTNSSVKCTDNIGSITDFTWLLFPFYYFSLIVTCTAAVIWILTALYV